MSNTVLELFTCFDVCFEADEHSVGSRDGDARHVNAVILQRMYECAEVLGRRAVVTGERGEAPKLAILNLDKACSGYASTVEERTVLESTRLLDTNV